MKARALAAALLLAGCAGQPPAGAPPSLAEPGWRFELHRPLTIPADAATVRLQYGRIVPRNSVQEYDPFCVVELDTVRETPQTLAPGRFDVLAVTRSVSTIMAARPAGLMRTGFGDDAPTFLYYITTFRLRDAAQPALRGMSCAWNQMAPGSPMRHLAPAEIRFALGDWMSLIPPGGAP